MNILVIVGAFKHLVIRKIFSTNKNLVSGINKKVILSDNFVIPLVKVIYYLINKNNMPHDFLHYKEKS